MAKDYRVSVKIQNGPLWRLMQLAGFETASAFAHASGVAPQEVGKFLNLMETAINKRGKWRPQVLRMAEFLRCLPEDMFPRQHIDKALKANRFAADMSLADVRAITDNEHRPDRIFEMNESVAQLNVALNTLRPRQQRVLRMRFGLDGDPPKTLDEVGDDMGIGRQSVAQIEAKALRDLRAPSRQTILRGALETFDAATAA